MTGNSLDGIGNFYEISKKIVILPSIVFSGKPITMILVSIIYYPLVASIVYYAFAGITGDDASSVKKGK
jgi:hypothetical protein